MEPIRAAFAMEQTLGHVTHHCNLRDAAMERTDVASTWLPISFPVNGPGRLVPLLSSNWSIRASWRARRALSRVLAAHAHDALVFHTQVTALFSAALMQRIPTVVSLDATPVNFDSVGHYYAHRPATGSLLDRQAYRLNRRVFHTAAGLVTWSDWVRQSLTDHYEVDPARVRVLAPGAAASYFDIGERRVSRDALGQRRDKPVRLLFVGGDFERKGGPLLLDCMDGPLADRCELHLVTKDAVIPHRNVYVHHGLGPNSAELLQLFSAADIFVLPTHADCLAVVLMEATAAGLPVITTNVGALGEAVCPDESGLLIQPGDGRALRSAVEALVGNSDLRQRMGRAGHLLAREKFDARRNNRALLDLVVELGLVGRELRRAA